MLISYEMFVRYHEDISQIQFDLLICDEGHRLKNTTIRTYAVGTRDLNTFIAEYLAFIVQIYSHNLQGIK